jgi:K(+)-stimulated pyrophosphate-energized sodium pump
MKAVGDAADQMMKFIIKDYEKGQEEIKKGGVYKPNYDGCIKISTDASLAKMILPGILVLGSPLVAGFLFGPDAVAGLIAGIIVSGVQVAISASNTGGAWDNAKEMIEQQGKKNTQEHAAAVIGDTVGDPLKDTSGPAVNILMKLMAIISLVFADFFIAIGPQLSCAVNLGDQYENVHLSGCGVLGFVMPSTCLQYDLYNHCK